MSRPKETVEDSMPEGWEEEIISLYINGASDVEVKAAIYKMRGSFSNDLWDRWLIEEPIFSEIIKNGRLMSEAWWHKEGRTSLRDKEFSYVGWYMQMKNRFGWADKQVNEHTVDVKQITGMVIK